jgi:MFS superfamily sulfate permease-like transporter
VHSYPEADHLPGLVIYRFDAPLFFANAKTFRDEVRRLAQADPPPTWILVAAEPVTDVDTTASDVLEELDEALNAQGICLVFAELKDPVQRKIERYGLIRTIDPRHFFPTIESAVTAFRHETGAESTAPGQIDPGQVRQAERPPVPAQRETFPHHPPARPL